MMKQRWADEPCTGWDSEAHVVCEASHASFASKANVEDGCPSVVIDIPDCEPHAVLLTPQSTAEGKTQCCVCREGSTAELYLEDGHIFQLSAAKNGRDWIIYTELGRGDHCALARLSPQKDGTFTLVRQHGSKAASEEMMLVVHSTYAFDDQSTPVNTMAVVVPNAEGTTRELPAGTLHRRDPNMCTALTSRLPRWDTKTEQYQLNFHGRCTMASSRNFQLQENSSQVHSASCKAKSPPPEVLLYGKVEQNEFHLDYRAPLSTLQAFAICLTSWSW